MFEVAILIGLYSYVIFFLGFFGLLYKQNVALITLLYILIITFFYYKKINLRLNLSSLDKISKIIIALLSFQILINLVGVLGPEISFDSLWYHLTLPKLYLLNHSIFHIPGILLYYSDMPKLTEMLYISALSVGNETLAKLIHFSFSILILFAIYKISIKYVSKNFALLAVLIFYSNLVVGWESITAYVDLSRTFFELLAFWGFLKWLETKNIKWILVLGLMMGFAISAKLVSIESIAIYLLLFIISYFVKYKNKVEIIKMFGLFFSVSVVTALPWFMFSYIQTGNPIYPYFSLPVDSGNFLTFPNLLNLLKDAYVFFLNLNDPISPVYLIFLPIILITYKRFTSKEKFFSFYVLFSILIWYLTQEQRGGRFIMPYLPVFSILCVIAFYKLKNVGLRKYLLFIVIFISIISIGYRGISNAKFLSVILGKETKSQFLSSHLNFSFGDFYDSDNYFKNHIEPTDKVLLFGFHNLYYVDFPYEDSSWIKKGDEFNYVAVQNSNLPTKFSNWKLIYYNNLTKVKLYSLKGKIWQY